MSPVDIALVVGFLVMMFLAGVYFSRWVKDADDFMVAGRQLTPFILAATITATNVNMYSFIGQAGKAYTSGLGIIWQTWLGNMALVFSGIFVVPILRRLMIRTVPEFLEMRYNRHIRMFIGLIWALKLCFYLAVILTAATVAARVITGVDNPWIWFAAFSAIAIIYSTVGGAWSVSMTDTIAFAFMLGGALIVLPIAVLAAGGVPHIIQALKASTSADHIKFVSQGTEFNWLFIISMVLLSTKWACIDQAILQRAFGAKDPRTVAKGMVLSGIITTPFAFLWILPGLSNLILQPGIEKPDMVIPTFLAKYLAPGVLGLVMCGLMASMMSAISADINSVATLFTSDIYNNIRRKASQKHLLNVVRISTVVSGVLMILIAHYVVSQFKSVVDAQLTFVGIVDMPVFVITIVYGLFSRRTNWQGAIGGYIVGATAGLMCYRYFSTNPDLSAYTFLSRYLGDNIHWNVWAKSMAALASTSAALIATPLISAVFPRQKITPEGQRILDAFKSVKSAAAGEEIHLFPTSAKGKFGIALMAFGALSFMVGVISGSVQFALASQLAVGGMIIFFTGGLIRVYAD